MRFFREREEFVLAALLLSSLALVTPRIAESDAVQYFSYLPSIVFDNDVNFENEYRRFYDEDSKGRERFKETFLDRTTVTGLKLNFGPIGSALLWSPFYIGAHGILKVSELFGVDVVADGMSQPYRTAVAFASALYGAIGLFLSYRLARRFASSSTAFIAVVTLWWASPVAYYMYIAPGMSHAPSLFTVSVFFSLWPWVIQSSSMGRWAVWGASAGLMTLVREQDLFFAAAVVVPLFLCRKEPLQALKKIALFVTTALLVFCPQLVVYETLYGRPLPAPSIQNKMSWFSWHFFDVLFSFEHGLFFWSPLLFVFALGGFVLLKRDRRAGMFLLIAMVAQVYISGAVDSWTQAGAFGSRRFVGATILFVIWGGSVLTFVERYLRRGAVIVFASGFILWNVGLMMQFGLGLMNRDRLIWSEVVHNQIYEVPPRMFSVVGRYFLSRDDLAGSARDEEGGR